jgi:hypothetical protein
MTNRARVQPAAAVRATESLWPPVASGSNPAEATHYSLVCDVLSLGLVFELDYSGSALQFNQI